MAQMVMGNDCTISPGISESVGWQCTSTICLRTSFDGRGCMDVVSVNRRETKRNGTWYRHPPKLVCTRLIKYFNAFHRVIDTPCICSLLLCQSFCYPHLILIALLDGYQVWLLRLYECSIHLRQDILSQQAHLPSTESCFGRHCRSLQLEYQLLKQAPFLRPGS